MHPPETASLVLIAKGKPVARSICLLICCQLGLFVMVWDGVGNKRVARRSLHKPTDKV